MSNNPHQDKNDGLFCVQYIWCAYIINIFISEFPTTEMAKALQHVQY